METTYGSSTREEREAHAALARTDAEMEAQGYVKVFMFGEHNGWTFGS